MGSEREEKIILPLPNGTRVLLFVEHHDAHVILITDAQTLRGNRGVHTSAGSQDGSSIQDYATVRYLFVQLLGNLTVPDYNYCAIVWYLTTINVQPYGTSVKLLSNGTIPYYNSSRTVWYLTTITVQPHDTLPYAV